MITISFSQQEIANLNALLDAGVRHMGLQSAMAAAIIAQKIAAAVEAAKRDNVVPIKDAAAG